MRFCPACIERAGFRRPLEREASVAVSEYFAVVRAAAMDKDADIGGMAEAADCPTMECP